MTGCDRILARLQDGPATAAELYATTYSVVHSRIAELRRRGHTIECERIEGETGARSYLYRLLGEEGTGIESGVPDGPLLPEQPSDGGPDGLSSTLPLRPVGSSPPQWRESSPSEQLTLEVAA